MTSNEQILKWPDGKLDFSQGALVMGILNVTPDSFSDGGEFFDIEAAVARGVEMASQGAAIIDIGPESTRPGSRAVSATEQIKRAVPVIEALRRNSELDGVAISIDTHLAEVARAAIDAGANMINDVTALAGPEMVTLATDRQVPVVLMHMKGTPDTMQKAPEYEDVVSEVLEYLISRAKLLEDSGLDRAMIFIDPGIGFGKTIEHNLQLLRNVDKFVDSGYKVLIGTSRKRFIGEITGKQEPADRIFGTAATVAAAILQGAAILRVHDVSQMTDVTKVSNRIKSITIQ